MVVRDLFHDKRDGVFVDVGATDRSVRQTILNHLAAGHCVVASRYLRVDDTNLRFMPGDPS